MRNRIIIVVSTVFVCLLGFQNCGKGFQASGNGDGALGAQAGCKNNQTLFNGACYDQVQICSVTNGWGTQAFSNGSYGSCTFQACDNGYQNVSGSCQVPTWPAATLTKTFNTGLTGSNIVPISVGNCGFGEVNAMCVTVSVCVPGTTQCQTIPDIVLSTDDDGLRIFSSAVNVPLPAVNDAGSGLPVAECMSWYTSSPMWGPIVTADVQLGGETAPAVTMQLIDNTYGPAPSSCANPFTTPASYGGNGILGVGAFNFDCGTGCTTDGSYGLYYTCSGGTCSSSAVDLSSEVENPIAFLPVDNNGVTITIPPLTSHVSTTDVTGYLIIGIGTETNSAPSGLTALGTDGFGYLSTSVSGTTYSVDVSSGIYTNNLPSSANWPACTQTGWANFLCPTSEQTFSATVAGGSGTASVPVSVAVGNDTSRGTANVAIDDLSGSTSSTLITLGVPYFFGRTITIGFESAITPLGSGPFVALPTTP